MPLHDPTPIHRLVMRIWAIYAALAAGPSAFAQELVISAEVPAQLSLPPIQSIEGVVTTYPINLPTALQLAGASPLDIEIASQKLQIAFAQLQTAKLLWLPDVSLGLDYLRHDGQIQDVGGRVFTTSKSSLMLGAGPNAVFAVADAIYAPLAARQVVRSRESDVQAARNDSLLAVAKAYFDVQQARGEAAGAVEAKRRAEDLVRRTEQLTPSLAPAVEVNRARTELERRRQSVEFAYQRWQVSSAELTRILRLDPTTVVEPLEAPHMQVQLIDVAQSVDALIPMGLTNRPELASHRALVQATLARLRQERMRPLIPSLLLRGNATNPGGTLSGGYFGGGLNDDLTHFGGRQSYDAQMIWELQNLGLGNRAAVRERTAENRQALLELFRIQDRVAAEIAQDLARAQRSTRRIEQAEVELQNAIETADKNLQGLQQTKRAGELLVLVFRPQEVVAAIAALDQAYGDYYGAISDANRAQFQLYRALGCPAQQLTVARSGNSDWVDLKPNPPEASTSHKTTRDAPPTTNSRITSVEPAASH